MDFPIPDSESGLSKPFQAENIKELEYVDYTCVEKGPEWSLLGEYKPGQDFSFDSNAEIIDGRLRIHCAIGGILGQVYRYTVLHIFRQELFRAGNQDNHHIFEKSLLSF